jgi:hypothetical protein
LKKNSKSAMKKEQRANRAKAQRPVQREPKEVLAELMEKLRGKLELKATSGSQGEAGPRGKLSPNVDRSAESVITSLAMPILIWSRLLTPPR